MGVSITYMGTKRNLAPAVCDVIGHAQKGIMLDAFAGMCSVAEGVATARQVWSNDIQVFAAEVARALFTSKDEPLGSILTADIHFEFYERHQRLLGNPHRGSLAEEDAPIEASSFEVFRKRRKKLARALTSEISALKRCVGNLFTKIYSETYFGIRQAIQADAIIGSIRMAHATGAITDDHRRWLTIGLGRALLKIANSTGHFAQYLTPNRSSYRRFILQRQKNLWIEWIRSIGELESVGTADWRKRNKCFNQDSLVLIPNLCNAPAS